MLPSPLRWLLGFVAPVLLPAAVAYGAACLLPLPWSAAAFLAAMAALALGGCFVLRTTAVQRITWRNHVAGRCLPFAQCMGGGSLGQVFVSSLLGSAAVGGGVLLLVHLRQRDALPPWPLGVAWVVDALMLLFLATSQTRSYRRGAPFQQRGRWLYLFVVVQIVVSVALHLAGHVWTATIVAGVPQVVVLTPTVLYLLAAMTAGRSSRWH
jgi:hypothetical protein